MARLEGSTLVTLVVGEDATLREVHVTRPIGFGLDENAIDAVKQWQFAPAMQGEKPVSAMARVDVNFRLLIGRDDWYLTRATFDTPADVHRPTLIKAEYPEAQKADPAAVTISFTVDEQGRPANIQVDRSTDDKSAQDVMQFAGAWQFQPATKDGKPVAARCTLDFARGRLIASE